MNLFDELKSGLIDAVEYEKGNKSAAKKRVITIADLPSYNKTQIREIRLRNHLTQVAFAKTLGVSIKTVEKWESGCNSPSGPSQRLLSILDHNSYVLEECNIIKIS